MSKSRRYASWARFIVLTGLSGSGKSQAIRALEDLGYYCVDNLPVSLLPVMAELAERQTEHNRVALAVEDVRFARYVLHRLGEVIRGRQRGRPARRGSSRSRSAARKG